MISAACHCGLKIHCPRMQFMLAIEIDCPSEGVYAYNALLIGTFSSVGTRHKLSHWVCAWSAVQYKL